MLFVVTHVRDMDTNIFLSIWAVLVVLLMVTGNTSVNGRKVLKFNKPLFTSHVQDNDSLTNVIIVEKEEYSCDETSSPNSPPGTEKVTPADNARTRREQNLGFCTGDSKLFLGDFNGDGKTDLLCHRPRDGYKWIAFYKVNGEFTGTSWEKGMRWCNDSRAEIHIGDFNGDGRSDLLCHNTGTGYKQVALANSNGDFSDGTSWQMSLAWCYHGGSELHIGDFNGDGRDDMLCHDDAGYKWIAYARSTGSFSRNNWQTRLGWCNQIRSQLFVGDFNGDSKSDLLCHNCTGYKWIAYANSAGNFHDGTGWEQSMGWCWRPGEELYIGDFNGDGKDDLMCHDSETGYKWVALANYQNNFNNGTSWEAGLAWCHHSSAELHVGDFNGDRKSDMLCHDTSSGKKWILNISSGIFL